MHKLDTRVLHHPVVVAQFQKRASDVQLRIADKITAFAGSMIFVYLRAALFATWMLVFEMSPWPTLMNGLDPAGILWIRAPLNGLAREGRTVFVSSHLMAEMALMADHFVIIGRGRLIADVSSAELEAQAGEPSVRVRTPDVARLREVLAAGGVHVRADEGDVVTVTGATTEQIGTRAAAAGLVLYELTPQNETLEEIFMHLTQDAVEYHGATTREAA